MFDALDMIEESQDRIKKRFEDYAVGKKNPQVLLNKIFKRKLQEIPLPSGDFEFDTGVKDLDTDKLKDKIFKEYFEMAYKYSLEDLQERNKMSIRKTSQRMKSKVLQSSVHSKITDRSAQLKDDTKLVQKITDKSDFGEENVNSSDPSNKKSSIIKKSEKNTGKAKMGDSQSRSQALDEEEEFEQHVSNYEEVQGFGENDEGDDLEEIEQDDENQQESSNHPSIKIVRSDMEKSQRQKGSKLSKKKSSRKDDESPDVYVSKKQKSSRRGDESPDVYVSKKQKSSRKDDEQDFSQLDDDDAQKEDKAEKKKRRKEKKEKKTKKKKAKGSDDEEVQESGSPVKEKKSKKKKKTTKKDSDDEDNEDDNKLPFQPVDDQDDDNYYIDE